jgi:hypothetical protein
VSIQSRRRFYFRLRDLVDASTSLRIIVPCLAGAFVRIRSSSSTSAASRVARFLSAVPARLGAGVIFVVTVVVFPVSAAAYAVECGRTVLYVGSDLVREWRRSWELAETPHVHVG